MIRSLSRYTVILLGIGIFFQTMWVFAADGNNLWITNIKHTRTNTTVNLSRDTTSGNNQADMFLWTTDTNMFKLISTIDVFKKSASLQITKDGDYTVRFIPHWWGNDIRYSFSITGIDTTQEAIPTVPKTGTTNNILLILGIAVLLYTFYWYKKMSKR